MKKGIDYYIHLANCELVRVAEYVDAEMICNANEGSHVTKAWHGKTGTVVKAVVVYRCPEVLIRGCWGNVRDEKDPPAPLRLASECGGMQLRIV